MFAMSVNEVPGWLVTIPPSAIGVPVAGTPGFVPHWDVLTLLPGLPLMPGLALLPGLALVEVPLDDGVLDELLQPAEAARVTRATEAAEAASTIVLRPADPCICILISLPPHGEQSGPG
jgi:hypothetical protein